MAITKLSKLAIQYTILQTKIWHLFETVDVKHVDTAMQAPLDELYIHLNEYCREHNCTVDDLIETMVEIGAGEGV